MDRATTISTAVEVAMPVGRLLWCRKRKSRKVALSELAMASGAIAMG
jgi:hypothetical protein